MAASYGDTVYSWHDISGHNWEFDNTTHNFRPVLEQVEGNNFLYFQNGAILENEAIKDSINGLDEFSIFAVVRSSEINTDQGFLYHKYPPDDKDYGLCIRYDENGLNTGRTNNLKIGLQGDDPDHQVETLNNTQTTDHQVIAITWKKGGKLYSYLNGVPNDSSSSAVTDDMFAIESILIGKGAKDNLTNEGWNGYVGNLIFYKKQYSADIIADISIKLPVTLLTFEAAPQGEKIKLTWTTATEQNNDYFTVERSNDGLNFEEIAKIPGTGNSSVQQHYTMFDQYPNQGIIYYRLKQTDFDGRFEYLQLISFYNHKSSRVRVFPNPTNQNYIHVDITDFSYQKLTIHLLNLMGSCVYHQQISASDKQFLLPPNLPKGIYSLECSENEFNFRRKIILQ